MRRVSHNAPLSQHPNKNVFSSRLLPLEYSILIVGVCREEKALAWSHIHEITVIVSCTVSEI